MAHEERTNNEEAQVPLYLYPFQLTDVSLHEIVVTHHDPDQAEQEEVPLKLRLIIGSEPPDADEFGLLLTFETTVPVDEPEYDIFLAIEGSFEATPEVEIPDPETIERFKSSDAAILLWPYLRQTLHDITTRMRLGLPPLPIIDPRALVEPPFSEETEEDAE